MLKVLVPAAVVSYILALSSADPRSGQTAHARMTPRPDGVAPAAYVSRSRERAPVSPSLERIRGNVADLLAH